MSTLDRFVNVCLKCILFKILYTCFSLEMSSALVTTHTINSLPYLSTGDYLTLSKMHRKGIHSDQRFLRIVLCIRNWCGKELVPCRAFRTSLHLQFPFPYCLEVRLRVSGCPTDHPVHEWGTTLACRKKISCILNPNGDDFYFYHREKLRLSG